jgi:hypothetical protein
VTSADRVWQRRKRRRRWRAATWPAGGSRSNEATSGSSTGVLLRAQTDSHDRRHELSTAHDLVSGSPGSPFHRAPGISAPQTAHPHPPKGRTAPLSCQEDWKGVQGVTSLPQKGPNLYAGVHGASGSDPVASSAGGTPRLSVSGDDGRAFSAALDTPSRLRCLAGRSGPWGPDHREAPDEGSWPHNVRDGKVTRLVRPGPQARTRRRRADTAEHVLGLGVRPVGRAEVTAPRAAHID